MTPEQHLHALRVANNALQIFLAALIKKYGKEDVIYVANRSPGVELVLTKEDLENGSGAWNLALPMKGTGEFVAQEDGTFKITMTRSVPPGRTQ